MKSSPTAAEGDDRATAPVSASSDGAGLDEERTGLPGVKTWPGVYFLVFGLFILWIALLTALTRCFS